MNIPIFNTYIDNESKQYVNSVLDSSFLSEGKIVKKFEDELAKNIGLENVFTVNSGTSALHLALVMAGVKEGDDVILPSQTFVATALVILQQKAIPVFADIDYLTGNISVDSIKENISSKTKVIIPVHWGGLPCDLDEINNLAKQNNITVIEDAAHALGAVYKGRKVGNISDYTCFSFQAIKHLTTGDGGAICCKSYNKHKEGHIRRWFGIDRENSKNSILGERDYNIDILGYKYHLNDFSASLGLANLINFNERLQKIRDVAKYYNESLKNVEGITMFKENPDRLSAFWLYGFHVEKRELFIKNMKQNGITSSVVHLGIDHNIILGGKNYNLINQRKFDETQINIPIHTGVDMEKAEYIVEIIKKGW